MNRAIRVSLILLLSASAVFAAPNTPTKPVNPFDRIESLQGNLRVLSDGRKFVVTFEGPDESDFLRFDIELEGPVGDPLDFRVDSGEIHYWLGHLIVVAPKERKALHFSMVRGERLPKAADAPFASASDLAELDSLLSSQYELSRIDRAVVMSSLRGPRAVEAGGELRSRIEP